jgi:phenylalanyl-tRNA synthetase beta chain
VLALDGKTYTLDCEMVVIADDVAVHDIGGVMGGEESSCSESTTDVFVESALFDPIRIARTGRLLGILSDARYRFERGVDPEFHGARSRARDQNDPQILRWPAQRGGGCRHRACMAADDCLRSGHVKRLGGLDIAKSEMISILTRLGFEVEDGATLRVTPPSWRGDIEGSRRPVEEIVRIHGLADVPSVPMPRPHASPSRR